MKKKAIIALLLVAIILGTTTALAASGYVSRLTMGHVKEGTEITLPENEPEMDGYEFKGWQINGVGDTYAAGQTVTVKDTLANGDREITFTAVWKEKITWTVKYAVRIYGIEEDVDEYGNKIGLTFGPAGGYNKNYNDSYCAHSGGKDCIHNLTWTEIIEKAHTAPHFFDTCLNHGCTHSVELTITNRDYAGESFYGKQSGDGASTLIKSLGGYWVYWNDPMDTNGGWSNSEIRCLLNGNGYPFEEESDALISAFPKELRDAIVPKAVKSAINIGSDRTQAGRNNYSIKTTYDKLWLFSTHEMVKLGGTYYTPSWGEDDYIEEYMFDDREGVLYSSQIKMNAVSTYPVDDSSVNVFYNETGKATDVWSRTITNEVAAAYFQADGCLSYCSTDYFKGISPGFCI